MEVMMKGDEPVWVAFVLPVIGAGGAYVGGRLRKTPV